MCRRFRLPIVDLNATETDSRRRSGAEVGTSIIEKAVKSNVHIRFACITVLESVVSASEFRRMGPGTLATGRAAGAPVKREACPGSSRLPMDGEEREAAGSNQKALQCF